jgi:hypothetical protein
MQPEIGLISGPQNKSLEPDKLGCASGHKVHGFFVSLPIVAPSASIRSKMHPLNRLLHT